MSTIKYNIIATGSDGNAVVIEDKILVDVGVSYKAIKPWIKNLKLVLLTHEHSDHFKVSTVKKLAKERPSLRFACGNWMVPKLLQAGVAPRQIDIIPNSIWMTYNGLVKVKQQPTIHDVPNCCWHLDLNGKKLLYATDTASMEGIEAKGYDLYMVEANRSREEIEEAIKRKRESGAYVYEYRVIGTHLMEEQTVAFLQKNMDERSEYIFMHQHKEKEAKENGESGQQQRQNVGSPEDSVYRN